MVMSNFSFLHLVGPYPKDVGMYLLSFPHLALGCVPRVWQWDLLFLYLTRPHLGDAGICLLYFSVLHDSIVHDVCIYIYVCVCVCVCVCVFLHMCGWLCTLKERKMGARTLPFDCWERWEIKSFCVCFGEKVERKRVRERESEKESS